MEIIELYSHATPVARAVMAVLVVMSVVSWSIIVRKALLFRSIEGRLDGAIHRLEACDGIAEAMSRFKGHADNTVWHLLRTGYREYMRLLPRRAPAEVIADNVRRAMRHAVAEETGRLGSQLPLLATTANTAPFIGLFGTVWGIMDAFHKLAGAKTAAIASVAPGISEALIATAVGLGVAIPAAIGYNLHMTRVRRVQARLISLAGLTLNTIMLETAPLPAAENGKPTATDGAEAPATARRHDAASLTPAQPVTSDTTDAALAVGGGNGTGGTAGSGVCRPSIETGSAAASASQKVAAGQVPLQAVRGEKEGRDASLA
ncbi:MotA/TolQ/ExbB proton channel family protein [Nitratidesulfovibrio vulgaris]|uniref:MotA/TolQ/ExbB proton channel family protein n=1 Tax=Nitratidesulfovibrio vulgaris TaxID=881 RepID=UPI0023001BEE|nr:MotA/TolQ/ExbB proton channel family protein [Nitratidesulfovibrio vulgaris]WCB45898.1 MotA/TolQ/ExbB proton channel family protein [Nitratidesulfovibrio vulgaris]